MNILLSHTQWKILLDDDDDDDDISFGIFIDLQKAFNRAD